MLDELSDHPGQLQLPGLREDEFLPRIGLWATGGGLFLVAIFGIAVALTSVLHYKVAVKVAATVRPAGELRLIQPAVEGTVEQIEVKENQSVDQGQVIARIDDARFQIQKSQLQESIRQFQLQKGQLDAQISNLDTQIVAESGLQDRALASAQAELAISLRNYRDQQIISQSDLDEARTHLRIARTQQNRLDQENELEASLGEARAALQVAKAQRDRLKQILDSGAISQNQYEEKEQAVKLAEAKLAQTQASAKKLREEREQGVETARAQFRRAQTALNPSAASVVIARERIGLERSKARATLASLHKERETLIQNQIGLQNQLEQVQKELEQVETNITQTVIRSPVAGKILRLQLRNQEQVVQPGQEIAYIAPANAPLLVKAQVPAREIDKVEPGQRVQVQVSACPHPDFGTLKARVKTIAPDALPNSQGGANLPTAPATYGVTIQPDKQFVGRGDRRCQLQAGMEGQASIISREETIFTFILRKTRLLTDL